MFCSICVCEIIPSITASSATPGLPTGSFLIENSDQSMTNITISIEGAVTTVVAVTTAADGGKVTVTDTNIRRGFQFANPPPSMFGFVTNVIAIFSATRFQINGADVLTIPSENNVVRKTLSDNRVEYENSVATLSSDGAPFSITENAPTFYYISPLGIAYTFTGNKLTQEMGEGLFLVDQFNMVAIFSQYQPASDILLSNMANSYQIQTPSPRDLLLRLSAAQEFFVTNITEIMTSGETVVYSDGVFMTSSANISAATVYLFGGTGFEVFDNVASNQFEDSTFVPSYDAIFYNTANQQILVSTSPILTQQIRQGLSFIAGGNMLQNRVFMVDGNIITYQGINVLEVTGSTQFINISMPGTVLHSGNVLNFIDNNVVTTVSNDVNTVFAQQLSGLLTSLSRGSFTTIVNPGSFILADGTGRAFIIPSEFSDVINFFFTARDMILNPVFPTAPPTAEFSLRREAQQVFLRINSMNVLEASAQSCQTISITSADTLTYNNGVINIQTQGTAVSGVEMLTVASSGQNVTLLQNTVTGYSISVDSTYFLRECNGKAVLTNIPSVRSLIQSAPVSPGVIVFNGQRSLFIGSQLVLPLLPNVIIRTLQNMDSASLRNGQITLRRNAVVIEVIPNVGNVFSRFLQSDDSPEDVTGVNSAGMLYAVTGDRVFFTDRSEIIDIITNELAINFATAQNQAGQTVLRESSSDVIILNGVEEVNVTADMSLRFNPTTNQLEILDSSNNVLRMFTGVNNVRTYLLGGPTTVQNLQSMTTINGPVRLYAQSRMGEFFVTDNPIVQGLAEMVPQPQAVGVVDGGGGNIILTIGTSTFIISNTEMISESERVEYSGSVIRVRDGSTTRLTLNNIDEFLVYLTSDFMPQSNNISAGTEPGPGVLYYSGNRALFTNRDDVISRVSSITPFVPPAVTTRPGVGGRVVLVIGGMDQIALNERPIVPVMSNQFVEFTGSAVEVRSSVDNSLISSFPGINTFRRYLSGDTMPSQVFTTSLSQTGPGRLILTSDSAFFTDRPDVTNVIDMGGFSLVSEIFTDQNNIQSLRIGGQMIVQLNGSSRIDLMSGEEIVISGSNLTIRNTQTGIVRMTFQNIGNVIRYLSSDSTPQPNTGDQTISGPLSVVVDSAGGEAIITNRQGVINTVSSVLPSPGGPVTTPSFRIREGINGTLILVINMMDIVTINDGVIRSVSGLEEVTFDSNTVTVKSIASGRISGTPNNFAATRLVRFLMSDNVTVTSTTSGPMIKGPVTVFHNGNELPTTVFVTDRQDIIDELNEALANLTAAATPEIVTPEPPRVIDPPEPIPAVNVDGSRWDPGVWSDVSQLVSVYVGFWVCVCVCV